MVGSRVAKHPHFGEGYVDHCDGGPYSVDAFHCAFGSVVQVPPPDGHCGCLVTFVVCEDSVVRPGRRSCSWFYMRMPTFEGVPLCLSIHYGQVLRALCYLESDGCGFSDLRGWLWVLPCMSSATCEV